MFTLLRRSWLPGVFLLVVVLTSACGSNATSTGTSSGKTPAATIASPTQAPASSPTSSSSGTFTGSPVTNTQGKQYPVGQSVQIDGLCLAELLSARTNPGDTYFFPKAGDIFLVLEVSVKNLSTTQLVVSSLLLFVLQDAAGTKYSETITDFSKPPDTQLNADASTGGNMVYEVPTSSHQFTLTYTPNFTDSTISIIWGFSA